ncbi:hypothetical protein [Microvirga sp. Mcv34]|uniref:hypothetical protein n=1 Tax=Microvirga sp. Mcv34 TaxID=2926016 RepID=UPI0039676E20
MHSLARRHDLSRKLIRIWVRKYEASALDEDTAAAALLQEYEARIAALERLVGKQALELEFLKGALKHTPRQRSSAARRRRSPRWTAPGASSWHSGARNHGTEPRTGGRWRRSPRRCRVGSRRWS